MAVMIPSVISPEVKSTAERRIFEWFQNAPGTDDWIVLHSLGIVSHNRVIYGETDFVVLAPTLGIYALEVKGGRVKCTDGIWTFTDKYGNSNTKSRGPFDQARDGIFSIMDAVRLQLDNTHQNLKDTFFGYGVMFPDITYQASGIDEEQWQIFDERNARNVKDFIVQLFEGSKNRWETVYGPLNPEKLPDRDDVKYLASILRRDFDFAVSLGSRIRSTEESLIKLTKEQYRCLDQLDDNPRCLIYGSAGTGKTLLAIEETKKAVARGEKVALFCFNTNLADWLNQYFSALPQSLQPCFVGTLHKFIFSVLKEAGISIPYPKDAGEKARYFQRTLPEAALRILKNQVAMFDKIIVDEGQDLLRNDYLEVLDACLIKGLSRGHWTIFGDFSMQAIYADGLSGEDLIARLENYSWFIRFRLTVNCRNTKQICKEIHTVTGCRSDGDPDMQIDGMPVQYITWSTMDEQYEHLQDLLMKLQEAHIPPEQITILSPKKREDSVVSMMEHTKIKDFRVPQGLNTTFCTIQAYKGLENSVIIMTDVDTFSAEKLMYVGLSRASSALFVLESDAAKREYDDLLIRRLLQ